MKAHKIIKEYGLQDFDVTFKNVYGNTIYRYLDLINKEVKSISINFPTKEATITIID